MMSPNPIQLPTESDFLDPLSQDLDERHALKMFLGKTPDQAYALFRENFLFYQEDLTHMRAPAFRFYVLPAINYLLSPDATGDSAAASTFCYVLYVLESRLEYDPDAFPPIAPIVRNAIDKILANFARFDCPPEIFGDLPGRYRALAAHLSCNS